MDAVKKKDILTGLIVGLVIFIAVILINPQEAYGSWSLRICDGFFVAAVMVMGFGGLVWCRNKGAFDMVTFGISTAFHIHFPLSKGLYKEDETFVEYKERKAKQRKPAEGILIAGGVYLLLSLVALVVYYIIG